MSTKKVARRVKRAKKPYDAVAFIEGVVGPLTIGNFLESIREGDEITLATFSRKLGVSVAHLCDIEKGRRGVSPARAARWARKLGYSEQQFVQLALQDLIGREGLRYSVDIKPAVKIRRSKTGAG